MGKKGGFTVLGKYLVVLVSFLMVLNGCAGKTYKKNAFWKGAVLGATVATPTAGILADDDDDDDRNAAMIVGMVAGGLIGGTIAVMNAEAPVEEPPVAEPVAAPVEKMMQPKPPVEVMPKPVVKEEAPPVQKPVAAKPAPVAEMVQPPPPMMKVKEKIVLRGINFDFDKSDIKSEFVPILDEAARILKEKEEMNVEIAGHTDWVGTDEYNQRLSERRANAVYRFLVDKGIKKERLTAVGYGEKQPIADNRTSQGRRMNRRVEFLIVEK